MVCLTGIGFPVNSLGSIFGKLRTILSASLFKAVLVPFYGKNLYILTCSFPLFLSYNPEVSG